MTLFSPVEGDKVKIKGGGSIIYKIYSGPDSDGDYKLERGGSIIDGYYKRGNLLAHSYMTKTIELGGFPCVYENTTSKVTITHRGTSYDFPYFGDLKEFLKANEGMIAGFFQLKVESDVNAIMAEFKKDFEKTIKKLKMLILPHTKDLLLSVVITEIKENTLKIADLFKDKTVKNTLLKIFK